jgi:hypothetical protein
MEDVQSSFPQILFFLIALQYEHLSDVILVLSLRMGFTDVDYELRCNVFVCKMFLPCLGSFQSNGFFQCVSVLRSYYLGVYIWAFKCMYGCSVRLGTMTKSF